MADYFLSLSHLQKGDAVAVYMSNRVEFIGIWLGLAKIGLVPALINSHQRQKSLEHAIIASNSKELILDNSFREAYKNVDYSARKLHFIPCPLCLPPQSFNSRHVTV